MDDFAYLCSAIMITDFEEYIRQGEPSRAERAQAWRTAIGLQDVDGLKPSAYLIDTARRDIEGDITIDEAQKLIKSYYQSKSIRTPEDDEAHEADTASANIRKILIEKTFAFTPVGLASIHRRIFEGIYKFAGKFRDYNITKKEWVLRGDTVLYVSASDVRRAVEYELEQEKSFDYSGISKENLAIHLADFTAGLWQIHPFGEGNTRTTAVFIILYLRSLGFDVDNSLFAGHSWYFRNALVRANYQNIKKGITRYTEFLTLFFRNLLFRESNELKNRHMLVNPPKELKSDINHDPTSTLQVPYNYRASTLQVLDIIVCIGHDSLSVKEIMSRLGLKDRVNFLKNYLNPSISEGLVRQLHPDRPNHPRQKYLLTVKGLLVLNSPENKNGNEH